MRCRTAELAAHVAALCEAHDIDVEEAPRLASAWAARELRLISIPRVRSVASYVVALHEIGHVVGRYQTSKHVHVRERWAWRFARQHALVWPAPSPLTFFADKL